MVISFMVLCLNIAFRPRALKYLIDKEFIELRYKIFLVRFNYNKDRNTQLSTLPRGNVENQMMRAPG